MIVIIAEEMEGCLVWCIAAGGNYISRNFGWPLRGRRGEGENRNNQMPLKFRKYNVSDPLSFS